MAGCGLGDRMGQAILSVETWLATSLSPSSLVPSLRHRRHRSTIALVHWALRTHARVKLDLAEGALVARHVLLQKSEQRLGLLGAEVDTLEVSDLDVSLGLLLQGAEN